MSTKREVVVQAVDNAVSVAKAVNANAEYKHKDKVTKGLELASNVLQLLKLFK